jgi:uncharacterized protein (DUF1810 family)
MSLSYELTILPFHQLTPSVVTADQYQLIRFMQAQEGGIYEQALAELRAGRKRTHWMWFIFPQLEGLGRTSTARLYSIRNLDEARAYLGHPLLGARLRECSEAAVAVHKSQSALDVFGSPDNLKLRSCATLFSLVSQEDSIFHRLLDRYFEGRADERTLSLLGLDGTATPNHS